MYEQRNERKIGNLIIYGSFQTKLGIGPSDQSQRTESLIYAALATSGIRSV